MYEAFGCDVLSPADKVLGDDAISDGEDALDGLDLVAEDDEGKLCAHGANVMDTGAEADGLADILEIVDEGLQGLCGSEGFLFLCSVSSRELGAVGFVPCLFFLAASED